MVFDPPKKPVNVNRMLIYSFIPVLGIYALWRIQKFWVILGSSFAISIGIEVVIAMLERAIQPSPFTAGLLIVITYVIEIVISIWKIRHYARKYNEKLTSGIK